MEVQLYVYDLSRGIARQMSMQFLGVQIDAVYHTSLVFGSIEYFFGAGVQTCYPGTTHHGQPMEVVPMGKTELPIEIILEYLESLKQIYTASSYDLFTHNCNNFTNDFATFLVGHGIPQHITSLPKTVLDTPFGRMLRPQIDASMRGITQAPPPPQSVITDQARIANGVARPSNSHRASNGALHASKNSAPAVKAANRSSGEVYNVVTLERLNQLLDHAKSSSAVIFFTSATCPPCKLVYPTYDQLAAETEGKCFLIKVDISNAHEIGSKYSIRATPTFISFLKGKQDSTWTGANPAGLQGTVRMLVESAFPPHPHQILSLPNFRRQSSRPIVYSKVPPLDKLLAKMGPMANDTGIQQATTFIKQRNDQGNTEHTPIPDMPLVSTSIEQCSSVLPLETRFIAFDLLRLLLVDPRISGYYVSSPSNLSTLTRLFSDLAKEQQSSSCPYNLRLCALHAACNVFTSQPDLLIDSGSLSTESLLSAWLPLLSSAMLDKEKSTLRNAAASLAFNLASLQTEIRINDLQSGSLEQASTGLPLASQVELAAALIEALGAEEESAEAVKLMVVALGRLVFLCPRGEDGESELLDLCAALDASDIIAKKEKIVNKEDRPLLHEIGVQLLKKGHGSAR